MKKFYNIFLYILLPFVFALTSCEEYVNDGIPSFIQIDSVNFRITNPSVQGSASSNISDVWVYIDNQHVGVYELPAFFPVLFAGEHTLILRPGIKVNGIAGTRMYYPFYSRDTLAVNLIQDSVLQLNGDKTPIFTYTPQADFAWTENFEDYQSDLVKTTKSNTIVHIYSGENLEPKYGGNVCGQILIQDSTTFFEVYNSEKLTCLPAGDGSSIYLEMDFKCDTVMTVGIYAYYDASANIVQVPIMRVNPTDKWKKIYIYLTNSISQYFLTDSFRIYISGGSVADSITERKEFYIDNLKLIY